MGRGIALIAITGVFLSGIFLGAWAQNIGHEEEYAVLEAEVDAMYLEVEEFVHAPVYCHTFFVSPIPDQNSGTIWIGQVELCGRDLEWGRVHGPVQREPQPTPDARSWN